MRAIGVILVCIGAAGVVWHIDNAIVGVIVITCLCTGGSLLSQPMRRF